MSEGDYDVGYKKPPKHSQFKPGQSGNPKGRPKGAKNFKTELLEELQERIAIKENGIQRRVSKQRAMLKSMTAKAVQGDTKAATLIANLVFKFLQEEDEIPESLDLSAEDKAILRNYEASLHPEPKKSRVRHRSRAATLNGDKT